MSCFSFGFIYQAVYLVLPRAFKRKGALANRGTALEFGLPSHRRAKVSWFHGLIGFLILCICIRSCTLLSLYMQICVNNELRKFLRAWRTLTSSLFSALKFIEKRHCFFKISLALISGSVHCWGNRQRVEIDIRGPWTSCAYHQRTSCSARSSSSQQVPNASFQTWVRNCSNWNLPLLAFNR